MNKLNYKFLILIPLVISLSACAGYRKGPDKQGAGIVSGAITGAGTGAVTGLHLGAGTGPGAAVGAGLGAVAGGVRGMIQDWAEEDLAELREQAKTEQEVAFAQKVLTEHYERRINYHPARDIFPADYFFSGDEVSLKPEAIGLVRELARLNKKRFPWSRLIIATYVKSVEDRTDYAEHLSLRRSREIGNYLVRFGIEPRRIETRGVIITEPIVVVPNEDPRRFSQAIELIPVDR